MIALKLLFQSLAGAGSVLVCAGGGYYVMKESNEESFYLVSSDAAASSSTPTTELLTAQTPKPSVGTASTILTASTPQAEEKTQKNYKCFSTETNNKKVDEECFLYSLTPKAPNTAIKISEIQTFISDTSKSSTVITKTEAKAAITAKKFFLLKAHKKLHTAWTFDGKTTIKLVEKTATSSDTDKTYATFQVHAKITSSEVEGKTSFAIVKYLKADPSTISIAANAAVTCKLKTTKTATPESCFVTTITEPTPPTELEKIAFTSITSPSTQQAISIAKDKYYLIQFKTPTMHTLEELDSEVIIVFSPTAGGAGGSTTSELKVQTPAFIQPPTTGTITEAIIIK